MPNKGLKVFHLISSLNRGGRERQLAILCKYTRSTDMAIRIICFNESKNSYIDEYGMSGDVSFLRTSTFSGRLFEILKILKDEGADVIWTWGGLEAFYGMLISILSGIVHINGSVRHGIVKFRGSHIWRMLILHLSRHRVANSRSGLRANFLKRGYIWYNGLDDRFFTGLSADQEQEDLKSKLSLPPDAVILISVANLVPYKDYFTVIDALKGVKEKGYRFHYLIVGEGPEREAISAAIRNHGLEQDITLLGRRKDIMGLLKVSNVFIHSSVGEGCSNAILEAMAAGKPVVATFVGGTPEIVDDSNSLLFNYKDSNRLMDHLQTLLGDRDRLNRMGKCSYNLAVQRFSSEQMVRRYSEILQSVVTK